MKTSEIIGQYEEQTHQVLESRHVLTIKNFLDWLDQSNVEVREIDITAFHQKYLNEPCYHKLVSVLVQELQMNKHSQEDLFAAVELAVQIVKEHDRDKRNAIKFVGDMPGEAYTSERG